MAGTVHVIDHPLVQHKLSLMRSKDTSTSTFRNLLREISMLLAYEVCRDLPTTLIPIETPIAPMMAPILDGKKTVLVSIMRAGSGILDGMLEILPSARVGHIGLYRDPKTLVAVEYYYKVPDNMHDRDVKGRNGTAVLTPDDVREIRRLYDGGMKPQFIHQRFSQVRPGAINNVIYRKTWKWVV